jgi:inosine/xanthosine triphosphatase
VFCKILDLRDCKTMRVVCVASTNPVKIQAASEGFRRMFPGEPFEIKPFAVNPGVAPQPMTDAETLEGAERRVRALHELIPHSDFWVGIEGGVAGSPMGLGTFAWVVVISNDRTGRGRSGEFFLPPSVADLVRQGMELGQADDLVFSRNNSKQENGAVGILTDDAIDRMNLYVPAVIFALIPFKNPELYP